MPNYMLPVEPGSLDQYLQTTNAQPPALPPMPTLNASSVEEPPLPPAGSRNSSGGGANAPGSPPSDAHVAIVSTGMLLVTAFVALLI